MSPIAVTTAIYAQHPFLFAQLPSELICQIFQHAAAPDTRTALSLTLVASWVRDIAQPYLYHTVVLSTARAVTSFTAALASKPASFAPANVKHLGILALGPADAIDRALDACRGVESLACGFALGGYRHLHGCGAMRRLENAREQHLLGMSCRDGWDEGLVGRGVTHLRIHVSDGKTWMGAGAGAGVGGAGGEGRPDESSWDRLAALPALTHLAIVVRPSVKWPATDILPSIFALLEHSTDSENNNTDNNASTHTEHPPVSGSPSAPKRKSHLALVLIQVAGTSTLQAAAVDALNVAALARGGEALRVVAEKAPSSAVAQWEDAVRGGRGVWEDAEVVVKKRLVEAAENTKKGASIV